MDTSDHTPDYYGDIDRGRGRRPTRHPRTFLTVAAFENARTQTYGWTHYHDGLYEREGPGVLIVYTVLGNGERDQAKTLEIAGRHEVIVHAVKVLDPWR